MWCPRNNWTIHFFAFLPTWQRATRLNRFQGLAATRELLHGGVDRGGPDEGLRVLVPGCQELGYRLLQIGNATEGAAANALARQLAKPALDQVIAQHQMQANLSGKFVVQTMQKAKELLVSMPIEPILGSAS